jgi:hypothetical protein
VGVVRDEACYIALRMIASEQTLLNQAVLDEIGKPNTLKINTDPDMSLIGRLTERVFQRLPQDISVLYERAVFEEGHGVLCSYREGHNHLLVQTAVDELGEPYVVANIALITKTLLANAGDDGTVLDKDTVNKMNLVSSHGVWVRQDDGDGHSLYRVSGTASRMSDNLDNWAAMAAQLLASNQATIEDVSGAASSFLSLSARETAEDEGFTAERVRAAALRFRASLRPALARVVAVTGSEDGTVVTVPFRASGTTHAVEIHFLRSREHAGESDNPENLRIIGGLYERLPWDKALDWAERLNGVDDAPDNAYSWVDTTPWLLGRWCVVPSGSGLYPVLFNGHVNASMAPYASLDSVIQGVVREVWSASDKYRLRTEFESTLGGLNGSV